jgi:hypothetical protein
MEEFKWDDTVLTIKDVHSGIDNFTLPSFSLGWVICQIPESSVVLAEFDDAGVRTLSLKDIVKMLVMPLGTSGSQA